MSYCRMNGQDSDVYVIRTMDDLQCLGCKLDRRSGDNRGIFRTTGEMGMIRHLETHRAAGHRVPDRAFERLYREVMGDRGQ